MSDDAQLWRVVMAITRAAHLPRREQDVPGRTVKQARGIARTGELPDETFWRALDMALDAGFVVRDTEKHWILHPGPNRPDGFHEFGEVAR